MTGYDALVARDDVDAVYIPLPPAPHHRWIVEALRAGKHVLAEKPLCVDPAGTTEVVAPARRQGLVFAENFLFPHHSQHRKVEDLVRNGTVGDVRAFSSAFGIPAVDPSSFRHRADLGGGALLDAGVHPLRVARFLLGTTTTQETATVNGVPQLIRPGTYWDKARRARLLADRGAGLVLDRDACTADDVRRSPARLLDEPSFVADAARLRDESREVPSPDEIVPLLEELTAKAAANR
ncbi:hypothetical protein GCM10022243_43490 [Saccharothrix violaceirubra]|uniref:Putative dehydrogenase n=1 Tax=Saccharothrix violaceirubra TaxID=413306 RepID=A0A7W7T410_9PSEU|nr:putative dehydrogenase [Saccharothrix violaceirubra]